MKREREKQIKKWFREYNSNKTELRNDYNIPVPSGIAYDRISVKTDKSTNGVENMTVEYASKREDLYKRVYIVDEVLRWFRLEGHGRERFIKTHLIDGNSIRYTSNRCCADERSLYRWQAEVLEKADTVARWLNY